MYWIAAAQTSPGLCREEALFVQVRHRLGFKRLPTVMRYV
jgi:hypothetical protein